MKAQLERQHQVLDLYRKLRDDLLGTLSNDDLRLTPGGDASPLGTLFAGLGTIQQAYVDSFRPFTFDVTVKGSGPDRVEESINNLRTWYTQLDDDFAFALETIPDDDVDNRPVDRGGNIACPPGST